MADTNFNFCLYVLTNADVDLHVVAVVKFDGGQVVDVL